MVFFLHLIVSGTILSVAIIVKLAFWGGFIASQIWPLSKIPGPWWARYTRLWIVKTLASGSSPTTFIDVNRKYGTLEIPPYYKMYYLKFYEARWRGLVPIFS